MTGEEWAFICHHLELCFAGDWDDDRAEAYESFLGELPAEAVSGAIAVLAESGQRFIPSVGEILGVLDKANGPPPFDRAWSLVSRALARAGAWHDRTVAEHALSSQHPAVLAWVQDYGYERLQREEVNDPQYGGAIMHRLSKSYSEHCAEYRLRERAQRRGLPGAHKRQLESGHG
jgi:hypothetical protein